MRFRQNKKIFASKLTEAAVDWIIKNIVDKSLDNLCDRTREKLSLQKAAGEKENLLKNSLIFERKLCNVLFRINRARLHHLLAVRNIELTQILSQVRNILRWRNFQLLPAASIPASPTYKRLKFIVSCFALKLRHRINFPL